MPTSTSIFCMNRRDEVIKYVSEKYGKNHVGQIITFGSLSAARSKTGPRDGNVFFRI